MWVTMSGAKNTKVTKRYSDLPTEVMVKIWKRDTNSNFIREVCTGYYGSKQLGHLALEEVSLAGWSRVSQVKKGGTVFQSEWEWKHNAIGHGRAWCLKLQAKWQCSWPILTSFENF